jgi:hypothetical protein
MPTTLNLVLTKITTPYSAEVLDKDGKVKSAEVAEVLTTATRDISGILDVAKVQWVFKRDVAESGNEPIMRGIKNFRAVFGTKMLAALAAPDVKSAFLVYEDDEVNPVVVSPATILDKYDRAERLQSPYQVFHAAYDKIMTGAPEIRISKKKSGSTATPAVTSGLEDAALALLI